MDGFQYYMRSLTWYWGWRGRVRRKISEFCASGPETLRKIDCEESSWGLGSWSWKLWADRCRTRGTLGRSWGWARCGGWGSLVRWRFPGFLVAASNCRAKSRWRRLRFTLDACTTGCPLAEKGWLTSQSRGEHPERACMREEERPAVMCRAQEGDGEMGPWWEEEQVRLWQMGRRRTATVGNIDGTSPVASHASAT